MWQWEFEPARREDEPIETYYNLMFNYSPGRR